MRDRERMPILMDSESNETANSLSWQETSYRAQLHEQLPRIIAQHRQQGWELVAWSRSRAGLVVRFRRQLEPTQILG